MTSPPFGIGAMGIMGFKPGMRGLGFSGNNPHVPGGGCSVYAVDAKVDPDPEQQGVPPLSAEPAPRLPHQ
jgi:hypothetical protein